MKTQKAIIQCAGWLRYCLEIGWQKSDLDALENLWWEYHDERGNLKVKRHR
jgi:hypothetical protein